MVLLDAVVDEIGRVVDALSLCWRSIDADVQLVEDSQGGGRGDCGEGCFSGWNIEGLLEVHVVVPDEVKHIVNAAVECWR